MWHAEGNRQWAMGEAAVVSLATLIETFAPVCTIWLVWRVCGQQSGQYASNSTAFGRRYPGGMLEPTCEGFF